jgi:Mannosyltransferase (PIG-V)
VYAGGNVSLRRDASLSLMHASLAASLPALGWRERLRAFAAGSWLDGPVIAMFVVSRLLVLAAAFIAETLIPRNPALDPGADGPILRSLTTWDGWYYLGIVRDGYLAVPVSGSYANVAFPPLYPFVVKILSLPFPGFAGLVAVIVSNVAFLIALGLLVRLGTPYLGRRRAAVAAGLLAIYPFASVFAMAYTESLFLLLIVAAFLAAERGHRVWAGVSLALAVLCRLQGIALLLPLLIVMLRQDGWRPRRSQAWLLLGPLAALGFLLYVGSVTGNATGYLDAQQAWGREGLGGAAPTGTIAAMFTPYQGALIVTLLASVFLLVFVREDRLRPEYWLIPVAFIAAEISSGSLEAVGRITMLAFPFVWILANRRSAFARRTWPLVSVGLFTLVAVLEFGGYWVP